ncbi:hypothetical protein FA13DRAFT_344175 [Coprinellus micaceus]|uniref:Uncharacterized protein n=1 Tax=Coprinellus micaceus TaxID=71717 RepID=A0A4Y7SDW2_COPMI|nr:hypothetical protein FA13DRAFT_344175 [Coprinellus micaceus]
MARGDRIFSGCSPSTNGNTPINGPKDTSQPRQCGLPGSSLSVGRGVSWQVLSRCSLSSHFLSGEFRLASFKDTGQRHWCARTPAHARRRRLMASAGACRTRNPAKPRVRSGRSLFQSRSRLALIKNTRSGEVGRAPIPLMCDSRGPNVVQISTQSTRLTFSRSSARWRAERRSV